jgi:hypothetical protein
VLSKLRTATNDDIPLNQHEIVVIVDLLLIKPELHIEVNHLRSAVIVNLVLIERIIL